MTVKVHIKWQKELFENVEIDLDQPPAVFKAQLFTLTGVPPERQKIMVKGGLLKDDGDWGKAGVKEGQRIMMMGTADKLPEAPTTAPVFVEDLPEDEQDMTGMSKYGAGLQNLGNTCYLNSSLQCLYSVPELRKALQAYPDAGGGATAAAGDLNHRVSVTLRKLFEDMDRSAQAVAPFPFLLVLREKYPQFAEQAQGIYKQQDAEECYTQLVWTLKECLKEQTTPVIDQLFGIKLHTSLKSDDSGETIEEDSTIYSLKCNISIDVNYLHQGVELALQDDRERHSDAVGGNTLFRGRSRISQLPPYVNVQLVRFFYKVDVQQKAKILRKVVFPLIMDLYDQCTDEYKKTLDGPRAAFKVAEDIRAGVHKRQKTAAATAANGAAAAVKDDQPSSSGGDVDMSDAAGGSQGQAEEVVVANPEELLAKHAGQLTGRYDLTAVLTHKGRSADSGHYVAWVKEEDGSWIQFDDEELIPRKADEIQTLAGGGDWHMAYLLLYRAVRVPTDVKPLQ